MITQEIRVPDIGDFREVPVIEIHVAPGDVVAVDDPLITLESDKATMDVPAPSAGTVAELHLELAHDARSRGGHLHRRLVRLQRDQRVVDGNGIAGRDVDLDHRYVGEVADVRNLDLLGGHSSSLRSSSSRWHRCRVNRAASAPSITRWS